MQIQVGDLVQKVGGDYVFRGWVISVFTKRSGAVRIVVENVDGVAHIFGPSQLVAWEEEAKP